MNTLPDQIFTISCAPQGPQKDFLKLKRQEHYIEINVSTTQDMINKVSNITSNTDTFF